MGQKYTFKFLSDPRHGWLSVPRSLVDKLGIADRISSFSYQQGNRVYLEEDCDAPLFLKAMYAAGHDVEVVESYHDNGYVRGMEHYRPSSLVI